ncbi:hypothetical protein DFP73DRAFT_162822 [Morchella snyderi]|nr:hypothetical protein DFP73DRAFT_162822 [Morchella snyderi]
MVYSKTGFPTVWPCTYIRGDRSPEGETSSHRQSYIPFDLQTISLSKKKKELLQASPLLVSEAIFKRNMTIRYLKPSSGAHEAEESKCLSGSPLGEVSHFQLQEILQSHDMKKTAMESRDQILGFEGIAIGDTLETASSDKAPIMAALSQTEAQPRELVTNNGMTERRIRRMPASVRRFLNNPDDGQTLLRLTKLPNPSSSPPYKQLFSDLDALGLASGGQSPKREYKGDQPSRGTPQHRNIEQSLDEILYLPSCG